MNFEDLPSLASEKKSGVLLERKRVHVALMPQHQLDINGNILKNFDSHKNRFHPDLGGILIDYDGVEVRTRDLEDLPRWPFLHLPTEADFFLFHPKKGLKMVCRVSKKEGKFVECLFLGTFRVGVSKPAGVDNWMGDGIELGQAVEVEVISVATLNNYPVIEGRLVKGEKKAKEVKHVEEFGGNICEVDSGLESPWGKRKLEEKGQERKRRKMEKRNRRENKTSSNPDKPKDYFESKSLDGDVATDDDKNHLEGESKKQRKEEKKKIRREKEETLILETDLLSKEECKERRKEMKMLKRAEKNKEKLSAETESLVLLPPDQLQEKEEKLTENDEKNTDTVLGSVQEKKLEEMGQLNTVEKGGNAPITLNTPEKEKHHVEEKETPKKKKHQEENSQESIKPESVTQESYTKAVCDDPLSSSKKIGKNETKDQEVEHGEEPNNQEAPIEDNEQTLLEAETNSGYEGDASQTTTIDGYNFVESRIGSKSSSGSSSSSEEEDEDEQSNEKSKDTKLKDHLQQEVPNLKTQTRSTSSSCSKEEVVESNKTISEHSKSSKEPEKETPSSSSSENEESQSQAKPENPNKIRRRSLKVKPNLTTQTRSKSSSFSKEESVKSNETKSENSKSGKEQEESQSSSSSEDEESQSLLVDSKATSSSALKDAEKVTPSSTKKENITLSETLKDDGEKEEVTSSSTGKLDEKDEEENVTSDSMEESQSLLADSKSKSIASSSALKDDENVTSSATLMDDGEKEKVKSSSTGNPDRKDEKENVTSDSSTKDDKIKKEKPSISNNFFLPKSWSVTTNGKTGRDIRYKYSAPDGETFSNSKKAQEHEAKIKSRQGKDCSLDANAIDNHQANVSQIAKSTNSEDDSFVKSQRPNKNMSSLSSKLPDHGTEATPISTKPAIPISTKPAITNFEKRLFGHGKSEENGAPLDGISPILKPGSKTAATPNLDGSVSKSVKGSKSKKHKRNKSEPGFQ